MSKVVLITGGSSGIGKTIGEYLKNKNYIVYGTSRNPSNYKNSVINLIKSNINIKDDINEAMFEEIKTLIDYMGYSYFEAPCEADELCAWLCNTNQVYGCMSEDSDMFIYGCKKVFKNLDFQRKTILMYEYNKILKEINITDIHIQIINGLT